MAEQFLKHGLLLNIEGRKAEAINVVAEALYVIAAICFQYLACSQSGNKPLASMISARLESVNI